MTHWLKLIRYKNLIIIALLQYLLRYFLLLPILETYGVDPVLSHLRFALLVIATVCLAASGYVINDYFDIKTDLINRPSKVLVGKTIPRRQALLIHLILTFTGVLIGFFLAYVMRKEHYAIMFLAIPILLWYYSTTLKKQLLVGNIIISILTAMVAYLVVSVEFAALGRKLGDDILNSEACSTAWFWTTGFAFFAFISNLMREIIKDLEDMKGDYANGCRTLPIVLGSRYTKALVIIVALFSVVTLWSFFFMIPVLQQSTITLIYFSVCLTLPYLFLINQVRRARLPGEYHNASTAAKIIMLTGILYIAVAGTFFQ
jgi:4-hydroxybenzoate polyprenyltransferase